MKLPTAEKGDLEILAISERGGVWDSEWEPLRGTVVGDLMSRVTRGGLNHALHGLSRPLVDSLGLPPDGALRKLPSQRCALERRCTLYDPKKCFVSSKALPWCYEPEGVDEAIRSQAAQAVFRWRERVYLVVVQEDEA